MADMEIKQLIEDSIAGQSSNPFYPKTAAEAVVTNQISSLQTFLDAFTENQNGVNGSNEYKVFSIGRSVETPITSFVDIVQQDLGVSGGIVFGYNQQDGKRYVSLVGDSTGSRVLGMTVAPDGIYQYGSDGTFKLVTTKDIANPMHYAGVWNASTNIPALSSTESSKAGYVYRVSAAGTQFGITFKVGDRLVYNESGVAEKWDTTDEVFSVQGMVGDIQLSGLVKINTIYSDEETGLEIFEYQPYGNNNTPASVHNKIMVPYATSTQAGVVSLEEQSFKGKKIFESIEVPEDKLSLGTGMLNKLVMMRQPEKSDTLDKFTSVGIYPLETGSYPSRPISHTGTATLIVFNAKGDVIRNDGKPDQIVQFYITSATSEYQNRFFWRSRTVSSGSAVWTDWNEVPLNAVSFDELGTTPRNREPMDTIFTDNEGQNMRVYQDSWPVGINYSIYQDELIYDTAIEISHDGSTDVRGINLAKFEIDEERGDVVEVPILVGSYPGIDYQLSTLNFSVAITDDQYVPITLYPNIIYSIETISSLVTMASQTSADYNFQFPTDDLIGGLVQPPEFSHNNYLCWRCIPFNGVLYNWLEYRCYDDIEFPVPGASTGSGFDMQDVRINLKWTDVG